ncbi:MAG: hypothetical protein EOP47_31180, partial [Sphingobacteriaceae bacterium]
MVATDISFTPVKTARLGHACNCPLCGEGNSIEVQWVQPVVQNMGFKMQLKKLDAALYCVSCEKNIPAELDFRG